MTAHAIDTNVRFFTQGPDGQQQELPATDIRILRRFRPQLVYGEAPADLSVIRHGLYVDVETTGLDTDTDEIIELGAVPFRWNNKTGEIIDCFAPRSYYEEPTRPLSLEVQELTGITPDMVAGAKIPTAEVEAMVAEASLVVAHSARFDRKMLERRFLGFVQKHWACSQEEVPWRKFGVAGGALVNVAMAACGVFTDGAHRAGHDCQLGVHVLATARLGERSAFSHLLESARKPLRRVRALGSPRWAKGWLKANGYRARYLGDDFQYWYKDFAASAAQEEINAELDRCEEHADCSPDVELITSLDRYSVRA